MDVRREWIMCSESPHYFVHNYGYIYDAVEASWIPFKLWRAQADVLSCLRDNRLVIILKARQLGQTWLVLSYGLWLALFRPAVTLTLFSRRDDEAQHLLERLRGIYKHLPKWMQAKRVLVDNDHEWKLSNGSVVYAFPTTAGDSYTVSMAIVDEADLVPNLNFLMNAVKPTIDGGGRMVLLSRANKDEPQSTFKRMYRAAKEGKSPWKAIFLPWYSHPQRDSIWYEEQKRDIYARTGSLDDLWQQYPADDTEALAPRTLDKRIPSMWLKACYDPKEPLRESWLHSISPQLIVYSEPQPYHQYVIGCDPAEGNPHSDPSALVVLDSVGNEEVCCLNERIEPSAFAEIVIRLAHAYNGADILPERNNHGHVIINAIREHGTLRILAGLDGAPGWHTNAKSKATLFSVASDAFRDGVAKIHTADIFFQLSAVEGTTLRAPEGEHDDLAVSCALALNALSAPAACTFVYSYVESVTRTPRQDRRLASLGVVAP